MNTKTFVYLLSSAFFLLLISCKKEQGATGAKSLVNLIPVMQGSDCPNGGVKIETGVDVNGNNVLDSSEVTDSQSICNGTAGANGYSSLVRTSTFSSNSICESGGLQIQTGIDSNFNGVLDDAEVQQTQQLCNGTNGNYDKQIAIVLAGLGVGYGVSQSTPYLYGTQTVNFNINNFPGVDSAVFFVGNALVYDAGNTVNFKLYNNTDNIAFDNSLVYTSSQQPVSLTSANIYNDLPKKSINFGIQLYVTNNGLTGQGAYYYLVLYRK